MNTAPAAFFAHGAPLSALGGDAHAEALRQFGDAHHQVEAIVIVSAHWQKPLPVSITSWETAPLIHDFAGFPEELFRIQYPAHGDAALATHIDLHLHAAGIPSVLDPGRGLDHGAWVPLRLAFPDAKIPVIALSLPMAAPRELFAIGQALKPLRRDGVMVVGSGGIVHNLRKVKMGDKDAPVEAWAREFDAWVVRAMEGRKRNQLFDYRTSGPKAALAVPTPEHFDPLFIAWGAAFEEERPQWIYEGFHYGSLSMRSVVFGGQSMQRGDAENAEEGRGET
jgi:4,5-DOPA dioxygenase extradiol